MSDLTLVIGGCRSGKSRIALAEAEGRPAERRIFVATAEPFDDEMAARIRRHRAERGAAWLTVEAPRGLPEAVARHGADPGSVLLIDCLTIWVSNLLLADETGAAVAGGMERLAAALGSAAAPIVAVSNEVGAGVVPENRLARLFRDAAGSVNQAVAALAGKVIWAVAGIGVRIK